MSLKQRWNLLIGRAYRCRCGAVVNVINRQIHEEFHDAIRDFLSPTAEDIADMQRLSRQWRAEAQR